MSDSVRLLEEARRFTPSQDLVLEVLAARYRLGESAWTFRSRHRRVLGELQDLGYVWTKFGVVERTLLAGLTEHGRDAVLGEDYVSPQAAELQRLREALERAQTLADEWAACKHRDGLADVERTCGRVLAAALAGSTPDTQKEPNG